jgi:hypothetical protein
MKEQLQNTAKRVRDAIPSLALIEARRIKKRSLKHNEPNTNPEREKRWRKKLAAYKKLSPAEREKFTGN